MKTVRLGVTVSVKLKERVYRDSRIAGDRDGSRDSVSNSSSCSDI